MNNKGQYQSPHERRRLLDELLKGKKKVADLKKDKADVKFITFMVHDDHPDEVTIQATGEVITRARANEIADEYCKQNYSGPVVHWVEFKSYAEKPKSQPQKFKL